MNTLDIAAVGLQQDLDRLKLISHNIANLSTTGYKRQIAVQKPFADLMEASADLTVQTDGRAGKLNATGQALDIALPEGRYLLLELADGSQVLSRQGSLQADAQGLLRTVGGLKVIGSRGAIALRDDQRSGLEINTQGQLRSQGQVLDALRLISTKPGQVPRALGEGLYAADSSQWDADVPTAGVRAGHLEQSNVVPSQEMVTILLHASDLAAVQVGEKPWPAQLNFAEDERVKLGGCLVQSAFQTLDARLEVQLALLRDSLDRARLERVEGGAQS